MPQWDLFHATSKIMALSRSGRFLDAKKLFDEMPERDSVAWNAMITSFSQMGLPQEALSLFSHMRNSNARPDAFTFTAALSASADAGNLKLCVTLHAVVIKFGYELHLPVSNSLINMYGKCMSPTSARKIFNYMGVRNEVSWCSLLQAYAKSGQFDNAEKLFDDMPKWNNVAWNTLIAAYSRWGETKLCMDMFKEMQQSGFRGEWWTFSSLMNVCGHLPEDCFGAMVHGHVIKSGWGSVVEVSNSVLSFYGKLGRHEDAIKIFESIKVRTQVSWNAMIDAFMTIGDVYNALSLFKQAPEKNNVSWTAMIGGFARNGHGELALTFFCDMLKGLLLPDDFTFGVVLYTCAKFAILEHGRMVHGSIIRYGFHSHVYVGNGLVNMYAKCGDIGGSSQAFDEILSRDLVSWNEMIFGFALHGKARKALRLYEDMVRSGFKPDNVTFIGLLTACSHSGLIEEGRTLLESMEKVYGLVRDDDHVTCMVDMLGRGGYLPEAFQLVKDQSETINAKSKVSCEALLGACVMHGDLRLGKKVGEELLAMDPLSEMGYVLLSNLYCAGGQQKEGETMRKRMFEQGVKKKPGCSWIEVRNMIKVFVSGDLSDPWMEYMCKLLQLLECEMRNPSSFGFRSFLIEALE